MKRRYIHSLFAMAMPALVSLPAHAGIPVFDAVNDISNLIQNVQLIKIQESLNENRAGTVNHYTKNISNTNKKIYDVDVKNYDINVKNIAIDADFTWIINKGDNEFIPVPKELASRLKAIQAGSVDEYRANFKDAAAYAGSMDDHTPKEIFNGSRARKAANDMLVESIELEQEAMKSEAAALKEMQEKTMKAEGHGHQLQVANALSAAQINQMMRMRNSMLASEAQRAAEAQVAADKDARAIAVAKKMRHGLADAVSSSKALAAAP